LVSTPPFACALLRLFQNYSEETKTNTRKCLPHFDLKGAETPAPAVDAVLEIAQIGGLFPAGSDFVSCFFGSGTEDIFLCLF